MMKMYAAKNELHLLERLSAQRSFIHSLHPAVKVLVTFYYIVLVMSFDKYEISAFVSFLLYPAVVFILGDIPFGKIFKRTLFVMPFVVSVGLFNPLFDHGFHIDLGSFSVSSGMISLFSIVIRGMLALTASFLLIAATGIDKAAYGLQKLGLPKLFVLQILMTYRYIYLLIDETAAMYTAYALRAPHSKGLRFSAWPGFLGQMILRTYKKAEIVYRSMYLRGFDGSYIPSDDLKVHTADIVYLIFWSVYLTATRFYSLPLLLEKLLHIT